LVGVLLGGAGCSTGFATADQRAALLAERGQYRAAADALRQDLAEHPGSVKSRRLLVRVLALSGDLGGAQKEAERLSTLLGPASPVPWIELGHAQELGHRYDEALAYYDRAAEVAPRDPSGPATGGLRAARWGEPELAEPRLEEALRRNPSDARLWHALGLVRVRLGDRTGGRLAYRSGLQADPGALENRVGLASVALLDSDAEGALREYDAILAARPGFGDGWLGRAWALILLGRLDEAERAVQKAVTLGADARVAARQRALVARLRRDGKHNRNR